MRHRRGAADRILSNITLPGNPFEPGAAVRADARALSAAYGCPLRGASCGAASARRTVNARCSTPRFFLRCHKCAAQFANIRRRIAIGVFHVSSRIQPRAVFSTTVFLDAASADSGRVSPMHEVPSAECRCRSRSRSRSGRRIALPTPKRAAPDGAGDAHTPRPRGPRRLRGPARDCDRGCDAASGARLAFLSRLFTLPLLCEWSLLDSKPCASPPQGSP